MNEHEYIEQIRSIVQRATAHNTGQTILEVRRLHSGAVALRMSSWPRMVEAGNALKDAGYDVVGLDDTVTVRGMRS